MPACRRRTKDGKKHKSLRYVLLLLMITAVSILPLAGENVRTAAEMREEETPVKEKKSRTVMYLMDEAKPELRHEDAHMLDQLNYSFALIRDGRADGSHWQGIRSVTSFLKKHPHIDGVLAVGGWGADGFSDACLTEEGRKQLADSILNLMDEHGFVGVDIDWEYPGVSGTGIVSRPEDVENWYALLELLREGLDEREALHGREYILSVALGAGEPHLNAINPARLNGLVDQAVVMAYDLCGFDRITGHHAGLYPDGEKKDTGAYAVNSLIARGLSPERILLGIPAYGRVWRQASAGGGDGFGARAGTSGNKTISFDEVLRLADRGYTPYYDQQAQAAYWYDGSCFVSAESDRSIASKCSWLAEKGLQGAAVWQYTQDASGAMLAMLDAALRE